MQKPSNAFKKTSMEKEKSTLNPTDNIKINEKKNVDKSGVGGEIVCKNL